MDQLIIFEGPPPDPVMLAQRTPRYISVGRPWIDIEETQRMVASRASLGLPCEISARDLRAVSSWNEQLWVATANLPQVAPDELINELRREIKNAIVALDGTTNQGNLNFIQHMRAWHDTCNFWTKANIKDKIEIAKGVAYGREIQIKEVVSEFHKMYTTRGEPKSILKKCMYLLDRRCQENAIRGHVIPRNILEGISDSGLLKHVTVVPKFIDRSGEARVSNIGINVATTHYGICIKHDHTYEEIDQWIPAASDEYKMLLVIERCAISSMWHAKNALEVFHYTTTMFETSLDVLEHYQEWNKFRLSCIQLEDIRADMVQGNNESYKHYEWRFKNTVISLAYGHAWYHVDFRDVEKYLYGFINVFPDGDDTVVVLSCRAEQIDMLRDRFPALFGEDLELIGWTLSQNFMFEISQIVFNPRSWQSIEEHEGRQLINSLQERLNSAYDTDSRLGQLPISAPNYFRMNPSPHLLSRVASRLYRICLSILVR